MKKINLTKEQMLELFAYWGAPARKTPQLDTENWSYFILYENGKIYQAKDDSIDTEPITEVSAIDLVEEIKELKFEWQ